MICPKTLHGCSDDLCRGGGCFAYRGAVQPLTRCNGCGNLVPFDGSPDDAFQCDCWPDEDWERDQFDFEYEMDRLAAEGKEGGE